MRIAIIEAAYYKEISAALHLGVINTLKEDYGIEASSITTYSVTGAYELPLVAKWALDAEQFDGVIALGCVIKGQTDHDAYINQSIFNHFTSLA
ncbi:MAG: 6,7-dimethyl-8-ribityllumazine synthase, partial [Bacteroidota bacterium]|nr:6,7-dimethyl-8-ribityllumazine synthase [Bacteroidota bacterium]